MQIDRIIYPVKTLGPGKRIAVWTIGCTKGCFNCSNPELWAADKSKDIPVPDLYRYLEAICSKNHVDGITFTGGDPLEQAEELLALLALCEELTGDILVYTGFKIEELDDRTVNELSRHISCLVDGRYEEQKNDNKSPLIGSTNQRIFLFKEGYRDIYSDYLSKGRCVHNLFYSDKLISVGIHNKDK
ncbi:MAG TPA: 4Fe-4S single cluster domain-containing protein [Clostridia bacterium]|nr:4Fe-4S single cluster domain-containing protein [Clostridia bacterium]